jgi:hypothetical protein
VELTTCNGLNKFFDYATKFKSTQSAMGLKHLDPIGNFFIEIKQSQSKKYIFHLCTLDANAYLLGQKHKDFHVFR